MSYVMLIVERAGDRRGRPAAEAREAYERMSQFAQGLKTRGVLVAGESLKSEAEAVRMEVRGGKRSLVDGPFAESKEMVGGFFLLNCTSRKEALDIAGQCPAAEWATVELREVGPCFET